MRRHAEMLLACPLAIAIGTAIAAHSSHTPIATNKHARAGAE